MGSKTVETTSNFARQTVEMPGPLKRIIAICTDAVMTPLALWTALTLKTGHPAFSLADWPAYRGGSRRQHPNFRAYGPVSGRDPLSRPQSRVRRCLRGLLERGIVGHRRDCWLRIPALSWSVVTIYSCLALLYVAGSRFVVRYYLLTHYHQPTVARVAIYGAGDAGARLSSALSTTRAFDPLVFVDDKQKPARAHGQRHQGLPPRTTART